MKRELVELNVGDIQTRSRLRNNLGDLATLEGSLRKLGLLVPIIVGRGNVLIAGGRRLQACRNIGMTTVPALRLDIEFNSMEALDIQSDENLCRQPLTAEELERHIRSKQQSMGGSFARTVGRAAAWLKRLFDW